MDKKERRGLEDETLRTLKKVSDHLYLLEYRYPYDIDDALKHGLKGMIDLALYAQKQTRSPLPVNPKPGSFACSAFNTRNGSGEPIMGRNFDYKESDCFVLWTHPEKGYRSISTGTLNFMLYGVKHIRLEKAKRPLRLLSAPFVPMDGMNEKGLAIAVLEIKAKPTKQKTGKTPILTPIAIRAALDKCATVSEAVELFSQYDMHDLIGVNYHYFISDRSGASVVIEYVNNEMRVIPQTVEGEKLVLTNHFLSKDGDNARGRGFERLENITCAIAEGSTSETEAMRILGSNTLYYTHPTLKHQVITVWSNVFNLENGTQLTCSNMDYNNIFRFSLDKPLEYERIKAKLELTGGRMHD